MSDKMIQTLNYRIQEEEQKDQVEPEEERREEEERKIEFPEQDEPAEGEGEEEDREGGDYEEGDEEGPHIAFHQLGKEAERVGGPTQDTTLSSQIEGEGVLARVHQRLLKAELSPEQQFDRQIADTVREYKLHDSTVENVKHIIRTIPFIKYRNAKVLVLAYTCLEKPRHIFEISKKLFGERMRTIQKRKDIIAETDLFRYARYLKTLLNKK